MFYGLLEILDRNYKFFKSNMVNNYHKFALFPYLRIKELPLNVLKLLWLYSKGALVCRLSNKLRFRISNFLGLTVIFVMIY